MLKGQDADIFHSRFALATCSALHELPGAFFVQLHYLADAPELSFRRTGIGIHAHPIPSNDGCLSTDNLSALPSFSAFSSPGISRATFRSASGECAEGCSCACECGSGSDIETTLKRRDPASLLSDDASEITGAGITKSVAAAKQAQLKTACRDCMAADGV